MHRTRMPIARIQVIYFFFAISYDSTLVFICEMKRMLYFMYFRMDIVVNMSFTHISTFFFIWQLMSSAKLKITSNKVCKIVKVILMGCFVEGSSHLSFIWALEDKSRISKVEFDNVMWEIEIPRFSGCVPILHCILVCHVLIFRFFFILKLLYPTDWVKMDAKRVGGIWILLLLRCSPLNCPLFARFYDAWSLTKAQVQINKCHNYQLLFWYSTKHFWCAQNDKKSSEFFFIVWFLSPRFMSHFYKSFAPSSATIIKLIKCHIKILINYNYCHAESVSFPFFPIFSSLRSKAF